MNDVYTLSSSRARIASRGDVPPALAEEWLGASSSWFDEGGRAVSPWPGRPRLGRLAFLGKEALVKREARSLSWVALHSLGGIPSRSRRAFEIGLLLSDSGVRAARPLALIEERPRARGRVSFLILERAEGSTLRDHILARLPGIERAEEREAWKERLWTALAEEVARLHAASVRQKDLKALNVLVSDEGPLAAPRLIDLEGMERLRSPPRPRARARDLARLLVSLREPEVARAGVSGADWEKLVRRYLASARAGEPSQADVAALVAWTARWAERKEARNRKRGRVVR